MKRDDYVAQTAAVLREMVTNGGTKFRSIIEFGPGDYKLFRLISDLCNDYSVVDIAPPPPDLRGVINYFSINISELVNNPGACDSRNLGAYDVVIANEVIEHFDFPLGFVDMLIGVSSPGALVLLTTPNVHHLLNRCTFAFGRDNLGPFQNTVITRKNFFHHSHVVHFSGATLKDCLGTLFRDVGIDYAGKSSGCLGLALEIFYRLIPSTRPKILAVCRNPRQRVRIVDCLRNSYVVPFVPSQGCLHSSQSDKDCLSCPHLKPLVEST